MPERPSYPTKAAPTVRMKDLPTIEQPSERIRLYGAKNRSAGELLATIIGNGKASQSAITIAQNILARVNELDQRGELSALQHMTPACLQSISGVTPAKAARIAAAVELGKRVFSPLPDLGMIIDDQALASAYLAQDLMWEKQEKLAVLHLDTKHRVISKEVVTVGTNRETLAPPEEIFRSTLEHRAYRILLEPSFRGL